MNANWKPFAVKNAAIRKPAVAGRFYPDDPATLRTVVTRFINESGVEPAPNAVVSIVGPHAGYRFSGPTAGYAYARCRDKAVKRVILLGCSHYFPIATASVVTEGAFSTPLGVFPIDEAFAKELAEAIGNESTEPHIPEHSLEVHLPFLAVALGEVPIVPILFGSPARPWHEEVGERLAAMMDEDDLLVCSTDLSHYLTEEEANTIDTHSLDVLLTQNISALKEGMASGACAMCGATAVVATMAEAKARGTTNWSRLDYRTSARASGDYTRVVGYGAVSMERAA